MSFVPGGTLESVSSVVQQDILRRVKGLFALADQLEGRLAKARGQVDALTPSLLARAFAGQLAPKTHRRTGREVVRANQNFKNR